MADGMLALAIHGELVPGTGRGLPRPGPFVANIGPDPCRFGLLQSGRLRLDRGVVGKKRFPRRTMRPMASASTTNPIPDHPRRVNPECTKYPYL